jgi:hypothetical protein
MNLIAACDNQERIGDEDKEKKVDIVDDEHLNNQSKYLDADYDEEPYLELVPSGVSLLVPVGSLQALVDHEATLSENKYSSEKIK